MLQLQVPRVRVLEADREWTQVKHGAPGPPGTPLHQPRLPGPGLTQEPDLRVLSGELPGGHSPSGEALGARGAGRFFVLGLLVGVMPYQGCKDLGVDSRWA